MRPSATLVVSIIMPCRNDAAALGRTLEWLPRLVGMEEAEVIVTASGDAALRQRQRQRDCRLCRRALEDASALDRRIRATIPGVVDTGLFLGTADTVLVAADGAVSELTRNAMGRKVV